MGALLVTKGHLCSLPKWVVHVVTKFKWQDPYTHSRRAQTPRGTNASCKVCIRRWIIVRGHIPILPYRKDYKPKNQQDGEKADDHHKNYMGKLAVCICRLIYCIVLCIHSRHQFFRYLCCARGNLTLTPRWACKGGMHWHAEVDIETGEVCLKQKYFNNVPANAVPTKSHVTNLTDSQWKPLVNMWSSPEHRVWYIELQLATTTFSCTYILLLILFITRFLLL
jgi:hypothetical protein